MLGENEVKFSGNTVSNILFNETANKKTKAVSFTLLCSKNGSLGGIITTKARINVYGARFFEFAKKHIDRGTFVTVTGELMSRKSQYGDVLEIRALKLEVKDQHTGFPVVSQLEALDEIPMDMSTEDK